MCLFLCTFAVILTKFIIFDMNKVCKKEFKVRILLLISVVMYSVGMWGVGWTPTDAGLVVNLEQGERFLLSVWLDLDKDSVEDPGEEFFVSNYTRYTGGYYDYGSGTYMKLLPATEVTEMNEWQVGYPLDRGNKALGGIVYTIWNDGKTLKTSDAFKFLGELTDNYADGKACDVVFVIPTERGVPTVEKRTVSSFDPSNTLGRGPKPFNGRMGTGFLGMTYREVYMLQIPKANSPQSYTNAGLVTFNTTLSPWNLSSGAGTIQKGKAAYAYADSKHDKTPRTLFRLYLLDNPMNSCSSYFFATDEQDVKRYRKNENNPQRSSDSTAAKKIYTMDRLTCMTRKGSTEYYQTDLIRVPDSDSTYYYVGYNNKYKDDDGESMGSGGAKSHFTKIRELPIFGLPSTFKAPAGAIGRMVADTTSAVANLDVRFKPAGYFLQVTTPRGFTNVPMRPNADSTVWTCEEMWHIDSTYVPLQIRAKIYSGSEYSPDDEGIDIPGWSVNIRGTEVPLATDHTKFVEGGEDGWARIYANRSEPNGYIEFVKANPRYHIHYDNNGLLGIQVPDQYPGDNLTTVTVEKSRLVNGFNFTGWNTQKDGKGTSYAVGAKINLATLLPGDKDSILTLYAQGSYTGTYHVAFSFEQDGQRYFLTQPVGETNRYVRARPVGDWTNTYQGMSDPYNTEPNYISTYKLIGHPTCVLCEHNETSYEYVLDPRREMRHGAVDSLLFYANFAPASDVYLGLYFDNPLTPFKDPVTIVANDSWAGAFTSTSKATATG